MRASQCGVRACVRALTACVTAHVPSPTQATDPFVIVVTLTIDPAREDEFFEAMMVDAIGSRKEPGCRQFDVFKVGPTRTRPELATYRCTA